jgi:GTP-binding protein EngB required for normal cell division
VSTVLDPNYGFRWCPKEERHKWRQVLVSFIEQEDDNFGLKDLSLVQNKEYSPPKWSIEYTDEACKMFI